MTAEFIFGLQFALSLIAWSIVYFTILRPCVKTTPRHRLLIYLVAPHLFRHVGLSFLVPGVVDQPLPPDFADAAAYGDLAAGILAIAAVLMLHARRRGAEFLVWVFNVIGFFDLVNALRHDNVIPLFGSTWSIPTFLVPLLLVTHGLVFAVLLKKRQPTQK